MRGDEQRFPGRPAAPEIIRTPVLPTKPTSCTDTVDNTYSNAVLPREMTWHITWRGRRTKQGEYKPP